MTNTSPAQTEPKPKKKHSLFYELNNPHFGSMVDPLFEGWRNFVHIVAGVFAVYKLLPRDYPGLDNPQASMSLFGVFKDAWQSVAFTKESAVKTILFFAVVGIVFGGAITAVMALFSMLVGTAHAAGIFDPESNDAAAAWLEFLFNDGPLPTFETTTAATGSTGAFGIQTALKTALAFYSNAILIIAALILFYHFSAMIAETAHTGVVMGKRANQVWAPIRLVVAIGLLVPIGEGLSAGQYIVIKTAQLGSGLATQTWNIFLEQMTSPTNVAVSGAGTVHEIASSLMGNYACVQDYNARLDALAASGGGSFDGIKIKLDGGYLPEGKDSTVNNMKGKTYHFGTTGDPDMCGWLFIASGSGSSMSGAAASIQRSALMSSLGAIYQAGGEILKVVPESEGGKNNGTGLDSGIIYGAISTYQAALQSAATSFTQNQDVVSALDQIKESIQQYGWAFAGTFFPTIERMQTIVSDMLEGSAPVVKLMDYNQFMFIHAFSSTEEKTKGKVIQDMRLYAIALMYVWSQGDTSGSAADAQCTSMWGLSKQTTFGFTDSLIDGVLGAIDAASSLNGVWKYGDNGQCANGLSRFRLGVDLGHGTDVLQNLVSLGHAEINTGLRLVVWGVAAIMAGGLVAALSLLAGPFAPLIAGIGGLGIAGGSLLELAAMAFITMGFVFAFVLPMIVFSRFFFAVMIWIGEVIESVIAMPLIALAHLNPEGDGLPGQKARAAYFMVFSIFLRPVLTIFGLIAGLLVFIIAANFLNFTYGIAVASTGGTAYAHATLAKFIYTTIYTYMMFVCANQAFTLVDHFPKGAMQWMSESSSPVPDLGKYEQMQQYEQVAAGLVAQQGVKGLSDASKSVGGQFNKSVEGKAKQIDEGRKAGGGGTEFGAG